MAKNDMNFYATLEEAIDAAREVFRQRSTAKRPKIRATGWRHYVAGGILC